jgi:hypothetical protein
MVHIIFCGSDLFFLHSPVIELENICISRTIDSLDHERGKNYGRKKGVPNPTNLGVDP